MPSIARRFAYIALALLTLVPSTSLAATFAPSAIAGSVTWDAASGPYVVNSMLDIPSGATLTILPGTVVKFGLFAGMSVEGTLVADDVTFTSLRDDTAGGDTNNDADATTPVAGNWTTILVNQGGVANISGGEIRYGGQCCFYNATLTNQGGTLTLDGVTMREHLRDALYQPSGTSTVSHSYLSALGHGIQVSGGTLAVESNDFESANAARITGNVKFDNRGGNHGKDGFRMWLVQSTPISGNVVWPADGLPYMPMGDGLIPGDASLVVKTGAILKMGDGANMRVLGTLDLSGVIVTSYHDDSVLGDTDNAATLPSPQDWSGVQNYGTLVLSSTTMRYGGQAFNMIQQYSGTTTIDRSDLSHANTGIQYLGGSLSLTASNLHDLGWGVYNQTTTDLLVPNNYWGAPSGPVNINTNPLGQGVGVSDHVIFAPWATSDPTTLCVTECFSNVLFLPGIESSRLYRPDYAGGEDQLWEPNTKSDVEDMFLDEEGKSVRDDIYTKDVIDEANVLLVARPNVYKSFLSDLEDWKTKDKLFHDYAFVPYDWRLSMEEVLGSGTKLADGRIYYAGMNGATSSPYIIQELRRLAASSHTKKVTIIAHSNGGLVAKALIDRLGPDAANLIDRVVFVAVPQLGTPQAIGALLHGYDQGLPKDWLPAFLSPATARTFASTSPMAYQLLPSAAYTRSIGENTVTPVVTFDDGASTTPFIQAYGHSIGNHQELQSFLLGTEGRHAPSYDDLVSPSVLKANLLSYADRLHQEIDDNWTPPSGIDLVQVAGFGNDTVSGIRYWTGQKCVEENSDRTKCLKSVPVLEYTPKKVVDGDGTVIVSSALAMSTSSQNVSRWWVDLAEYDTLFSIERKHADILEVLDLRNFLKEQIAGHELFPTHEFVTPLAPNQPSGKRLVYFLHSPLALSVRDGQGNEVNESMNTISGAHFTRFGEVQYISVPADIHPEVILRGVEDGSFSLEVEETEGGQTIATTTFTGIPSGLSTVVRMKFPDGTIIGAGPLRVDQDANGIDDIILHSKPGEIITLAPFDTTSPATAASTTGIRGVNGWHLSDVTVAFMATDTESGVASTSYSIDGAEWQSYSAPLIITKEGSTSISFYTTDKAGNREATNTLVIQIDKTAPEANISVSTSTQDILVEGSDGNGMVSVTKDASGSYVLVDQAGHITRLFFVKAYSGKLLTYAKLAAIQYDSALKVGLPSTSFLYVWDTKPPALLLSQTIAVDSNTLVQAIYDKRVNKTTIVVIKKGASIQSQTFMGIRIVKISSNRGMIGYHY